MCKSVALRCWYPDHDVNSKNVSQGGEGTVNADIMHRQVIPPPCTRPMFDHITDTGRYAHHQPRWSHLEDVWGDSDREELTMIWHNLDGTNF
jgi:hypothetical protein